MGRKIMEKLKSLVRKRKGHKKAVKKCCHENQCGCNKGQCSCENGPFR